MKKSLLIMAMVGLVLWFPLLADAKGGKDAAKQVKALQKEIKNLQKEIENLEKQIDKIQLTPGPVGPQGPAGTDGQDGADSTVPGPPGADGYTPVKGVDYFDGADGLPGEPGPPGPAWVAGDGTDLDSTIDDLYNRVEDLESFFFRTTRFTDMGDGTIRDNDTGLIWLKDASCDTMPNTTDGKANWAKAKAAAAALSQGTCRLNDRSAAGDWRLPTKAEWSAVMVCDENDIPCIFTRRLTKDAWMNEFTDVMVGYWSGTQGPGETATYVNLQELYTADASIYYETIYVWPVRSGN